jgi:hypothetical protein
LEETLEADISIWRKTGHFYFALTLSWLGGQENRSALAIIVTGIIGESFPRQPVCRVFIFGQAKERTYNARHFCTRSILGVLFLSFSETRKSSQSVVCNAGRSPAAFSRPPGASPFMLYIASSIRLKIGGSKHV